MQLLLGGVCSTADALVGRLSREVKDRMGLTPKGGLIREAVNPISGEDFSSTACVCSVEAELQFPGLWS